MTMLQGKKTYSNWIRATDSFSFANSIINCYGAMGNSSWAK